LSCPNPCINSGLLWVIGGGGKDVLGTCRDTDDRANSVADTKYEALLGSRY